MKLKQKAVQLILANLPKYNADDVMKVKLISGKPITMTKYIDLFKDISRNRQRHYWYRYGNNFMSNNTESYSNYAASENIKRILKDDGKLKRISLTDLKGVLHILNKDAEKEIIDIQVKQSAERYIEMQNTIHENQW